VAKYFQALLHIETAVGSKNYDLRKFSIVLS
jgi:hypothetical protein